MAGFGGNLTQLMQQMGGAGGIGGGGNLLELLQQAGATPGLTDGVKGEDFWANAAPEDYALMAGKMMQQMGSKAPPPPQGSIPSLPSSFSPADSSTLAAYSPQRVSPLGLLEEDDEKQKLRMLIGGLLS